MAKRNHKCTYKSVWGKNRYRFHCWCKTWDQVTTDPDKVVDTHNALDPGRPKQDKPKPSTEAPEPEKPKIYYHRHSCVLCNFRSDRCHISSEHNFSCPTCKDLDGFPLQMIVVGE